MCQRQCKNGFEPAEPTQVFCIKKTNGKFKWDGELGGCLGSGSKFGLNFFFLNFVVMVWSIPYEIRPVIKLLAQPMTNQLMINPKMVITVTSPMVDGMVTGVTMVTNLMVTTVTGATNPMVTGVTTVTNQMVTTVISPMVTGVTNQMATMVTNQWKMATMVISPRMKNQNQLISLPSLIIQDVKKLNWKTVKSKREWLPHTNLTEVSIQTGSASTGSNSTGSNLTDNRLFQRVNSWQHWPVKKVKPSMERKVLTRKNCFASATKNLENVNGKMKLTRKSVRIVFV